MEKELSAEEIYRQRARAFYESLEAQGINTNASKTESKGMFEIDLLKSSQDFQILGRFYR